MIWLEHWSAFLKVQTICLLHCVEFPGNDRLSTARRMSASMLCRSLPFHISVFLSRCIFDFSCSLARILRYVWFYFNAQTVDESAFYYENFSSYCSQELSDFGRRVFISLVNSVAAYLLEAVGVGFSAFLFPDLDFDTIDTFQDNLYLMAQYYFC